MWGGRPVHRSGGPVRECPGEVFPAYRSAWGTAFLDRALYLPRSWTRDPARCAAAGIPAGAGFAMSLPRVGGDLKTWES